MADYPIVYVEWGDPKQEHGWTSKLADALAEIRTVGFLIRESEDGVSVVESIAAGIEEPWGCSTFIPNRLIHRMQTLDINEPEDGTDD